ncbi:MAG: PTS sugar transporter subunit IIA [Erysipelotrichaceae bacterium]|nr:PTS sugar transporter subunit IIA [Erysipelotrichaceae bacterium]
MGLLKNFVENKVTCYHKGFDNWEEAIKASGQPLIDSGFIDDRYIDAVIKCVHDFGPYIVIAPNIAMPHSTTGATGVYKTTIGFMRLEEPVHFEENNPEKDARLFFMLAAENHDLHLQNMMELSELLMDEEVVEELLKVENDDQLLALADKYE